MVEYRKKPSRESKEGDYIDKKQLYDDLLEYKNKVAKAEEEDLPLPRIPEKIGKAIIKICENLGRGNSYRNYPFIDEMVAGAIENCLNAVKSYNPDDPQKNPFGYFSMVASRYFHRHIKAEKKKMHGKAKLIRQSGIIGLAYQLQDGDGGVYESSDLKFLQDFVDEYDYGVMDEEQQQEKSSSDKDKEEESESDDEDEDSNGLKDFME